MNTRASIGNMSCRLLCSFIQILIEIST